MRGGNIRAQMASRSAIGTALLCIPVVALLLSTRLAQASSECVGDCNRDGQVTIDELVTLVNVILAFDCPFEPELCARPLNGCAAPDRNGDGEFTTDELLVAVNDVVNAVGNALDGCP